MGDEATPRNLENSRARLALTAVAVAVAVAVAGSGVARLRRSGIGSDRRAVQLNVRRAPAGPEVRALFAPLTEGSEVAGWRIHTIEGVRLGCLHVVVTRGANVIEVLVARREGTAVAAPLTVGPYALFNMGLPSLDGEALRVIRALAERLRSNASAPIPPGLGPFLPGRS